MIQRLIEIGKLIISESDIDKVLTIAIDQAIEIANAERGLVILFDEDEAILFQTARHLNKQDIEKPEFEISRTIINKVKCEKTIFYRDDALKDKEIQKSSSAARLNILSVICLPLCHEEKLFGVVYLDNRTVEGVFSEQTCHFIENFGEFISLAAYHALDRKRLLNHISALGKELRDKYRFENIIGHHPKMVEILKLVAQIAESEATILIQGESGTGKELVARAIHFNSRRNNKPFVPINCGAIPESLLESELFGHVKGAFTGAINDKVGWFETADAGTIFLDEVSEMTPALQVKLLRVLQSGEYSKVGSTNIRTCNVRIIAATNKDLFSLVEKEQFRQDLYYRLDVIKIDLPPLRDRRSDIPLLIHHFLEKYNAQCGKEIRGLSQNAESLLMEYEFPGNVRELENAIEHGVTITDRGVIELHHLPTRIRQSNEILSSSPKFENLKDAKRDGSNSAEKSYIIDCLKTTKGDVREAAIIAGIDISNFYKIMKKHEIDLLNYKSIK